MAKSSKLKTPAEKKLGHAKRKVKSSVKKGRALLPSVIREVGLAVKEVVRENSNDS